MNDYFYYMKLYFSLAIWSNLFLLILSKILINFVQHILLSCIFVFTNNSKIWYLFKYKC